MAWWDQTKTCQWAQDKWCCKTRFRKLKTRMLGFCFKSVLLQILRLWVFSNLCFLWFLLPTPKFSSVEFLLLSVILLPLYFLPRFPFPGVSCFQLAVVLYHQTFLLFYSETLFLVSFYFCSLWLLPYFCLLKQPLCFKCALLLSSDCSDPFLKWVVGSCDDKSSDAILFSLPFAAIPSELKLEGEMERNLWWHKWAAVLLCFP